jgi:C-terminal peptidase prc
LALAFLLAGPLAIGGAAALPEVRHDDLRQQALAFEKKSAWLEACRCYDELLRRDRTQTEVRQAYQHALRRYYLVRRHRDPAYRQMVSRLSSAQALDLYEQVLSKVAAAYVDRGDADLTRLFRLGVEELRFALQEDSFLRDYLAEAKTGAAAAFKDRLDELARTKVATRTDAREKVLATARAAQQEGLSPRLPSLVTLLALEFVSGTCNGLDEYSQFLPPGQFSDLQSSLRGRFVGIGVDLAVIDQRLEIARVYPRSPAAEAGLLRRDRILRIDRQVIDDLAPDVAADRLRGEAGSQIELEVVSAGQAASHGVRLVRRSVVMPSVEQGVFDEGEAVLIGYLRIAAFQENTVQEVREALAQFATAGVRALVLDLRGNPGGAFRPAVQVAELFLGEGVIVHGQSQLREYNRLYRADLPNPFARPVVVLVDGETASSAELVAGALKEHGRLVVGQTTYGKGSVQCVLPLERYPAGLRLTVARFYSPLKNPYTGRGVIPDVLVDQEGDAALAAARQEARLRVAMMPPVRPN